MGICKQCKQLFYIELQNRQFRENRSTYKLSNLSNSQGPRACARAREIKIYILIYRQKKAFVYL